MEFELDEYLGLPKDSYNMEGGAGRYQIIGTSSSEMNKSKEDVLTVASIIVEGSEKTEKNTIDEIKTADISGTILAVTGSAVSAFLEDYAKPETAPEVDTSVKSNILDKLFQESEPGKVTTLLNQTKQFAFLTLFHDLHARAVLAEMKGFPTFDASFLDKYTWMANLLKEAKGSGAILGELTIENIVEKWNSAMSSELKFEDIQKMILNPPDLIQFLQGVEVEEEEEEEEEGEGNDLSAAAAAAVEGAAGNLEGKKPGTDGLDEAAGETVEGTATELGSGTKGGAFAFAEPKTAEEYLMDLGEFVA